MDAEMVALPAYQHTMERLEQAKRTSAAGEEFWLARDLLPILGYDTWRRFDETIERAKQSLRSSGIDPSHHFAETGKMVELGSASQRRVIDYFLSRAACYLLAMNGDPTKAEIAAAQSYFLVQTRRMELSDERTDDEKRLDLREKVSQSAKTVSAVAQKAGVRSQMQGVFHDKRYQGLYGMSLKDLKDFKGLDQRDQLLDRAGLLELSMHEFQMNLAADVITKDSGKSEVRAMQTNLDVARRVRLTVEKSGGTLPEKLPIERPIKELKKLRESGKKITKPPSPSST